MVQKALFLLFLLLSDGSCPRTKPSVKVVSPVYLKEVPNIVKYEATLPIFFNVTLERTNSPQNPATCNGDESYCEMKKEAFGIYQSMINELIWNEDDDEDGSNDDNGVISRIRRFLMLAAGAIAGFFLRPIINKLTGGLFGGDDEWRSHFNELRSSVVQEQQEMFRFHAVEKNLTSIMWKSVNILKQRMDDLLKSTNANEKRLAINVNQLTDLLHTKLEADEMHRALDSCRVKHIPIGLISPALFAEKVRDVNKLIKPFGYRLAIKSKHLSEFLKLPLTDCMFTDNNVLVTVNMPLIRIESDWKLFEIIHLKFAYKGQVCDLYPQEASFLARTENRVVLINGHLLHYCNVYEHKICLIPPYLKESSQSLACVVGMMERKSVGELSKSCSFRCSTDQELIINQIDQQTLVVTNVENVTTVCGKGGPITKLFPKLGAVEIKLHCQCTIFVDGKKLQKPFPCVNDLSIDEIVFHSVPLLWTTLHDAVGKDSSLILNGYEKVIADDWPQNFAIFNLTPKEIYVPPPVSDTWNYQDIWLMVLSVVVACLFFCFCIILKVMVS